MRGKVHFRDLVKVSLGITPAYAGKSLLVCCLGFHCKDHPRICGEKRPAQRDNAECRGSPPHMRGKEAHIRRRAVDSGITPAYAGKRRFFGLISHVPWDHPRICGEKKKAVNKSGKSTGSPPHMRGKGLPTWFLSMSRRITPAYAGKRLKRSRSTVPPVAIVPLFPSVCNKPVVSDGSPAGRDAPLFLPAENTVLASPAYNLRSL